MAIQIVAEKMVFGGNCLAKVNGKNVFVPYAVPGETLEIEVTKSFRDYDLARITRIIKASPHRVQPFCPLYEKCGGCNMQHISAEYQRTLRANMLKDSFAREGLTVPDVQIISGSEKSYRARIQLTSGGFNEKESNAVVPLASCPVATDCINSYLAAVPQDKRPLGRVHIFGDSRVQNASVFEHLILAEEKKSLKLGQQDMSEKLKKRVKHYVKPRFAGTIADEANTCQITLAGKTIQFDARGFFQSNLDVLEKTIATLTTNLGGKNALDMYAGAGVFSVFLSDLFEKVTLVEHNRDALVQAEINLAGKKHESYGVSGAKWVRENAAQILSGEGNFDAVIIDPPRSGMEKEVRDWLCANKVGQIRSVSCDPATHARDAAALVKSGYSLAKLYLLDFYPQTSHIESLAFFEHFED